ncbi:cytochrome b/b6 domain-containing protein [Novosphingobium lentum]|uniref:cytochrome b/b6 domain-containing protein n=1 Tax=Novosphingobium lentum TaxID=145287 RepID=UPI000AFEB52B|nr:cytochrome b/b6 domain-containing protein [Novosphingobium lentum]
MTDQTESPAAPVVATTPAPTLIYRTRLPIRLWHWTNALAIFCMLMSGMMIFNAHPMLYWGKFGANLDHPWLVIGHHATAGFIRLGSTEFPTTGLLGYAQGAARAFPPLVTIPSGYDLASARQWHFFFAWLLVVPGLLFVAWALISRHLRDLAPTLDELRPSHLWADIKAHARLRFPTGEAARHYNPLQKISYVVVIFLLIPGVVLTGLTMSPGMDAAWPWLLDLFGGRQSARSIHFICAAAIAGFIAVHLIMVVLAGPINELRSMVTGWYRLPRDKPSKEIGR